MVAIAGAMIVSHILPPRAPSAVFSFFGRCSRADYKAKKSMSSNQPETVFACGCKAVVTSDFTILGFTPVCDEMIARCEWQEGHPDGNFLIFHFARQALELGSGGVFYVAAKAAIDQLSVEYDSRSKTRQEAINEAVLQNKHVVTYRWGTVFQKGTLVVAFAWKGWLIVMALVTVVALIEGSCNILK